MGGAKLNDIVGQEELISVIVPVYNAEEHLRECLESIIQQTYENLEIIVVNDGSSDQSEKIITEIQQTDLRIRLISQENAGVSAARNAGLKAAHGAYIGFVDADDWIHPDMYRQLCQNLCQYNADISEIGITRKKDRISRKEKGKVALYNRDEYMKKFFKISSQEIKYYVDNKLFRSDIIRNAFFPPYAIGEDVVLLFTQ